jgi:transcriptional regulator with XRE-family HTH domain
MFSFENMYKERVEILEKIKEFRDKNGFSQEQMADKMNITQSKYARFESGRTKTDLDTLELFCNQLEMTLKEFFIYPDNINIEVEEIKAILQIELKRDKKEQVLKLVFGDNNLEILNK